jgi:hypothetical protein
VVDLTHKPLSGASIRVHQVRGLRSFDVTGSASASSDARGRFTLNVPPGEIVLRADAGPRGAALSAPLYVSPTTHLEGVTIRVVAGLALSGRVLARGGQRVTGAQVYVKDSLGRRRLPCDAEGAFAAHGFSPGTKLLQALAPGYSPSQVVQVELRPNKPQRAVLEVLPAKGVGGQVVNDEGSPLANVRVTVRPGSARSRVAFLLDPPERLTSEEGRFKFNRVPRAPLVITARGPGNVSASRAGVAPGSFDNVIRLQPSGAIVGQVTDHLRGEPIRDFTVAVTASSGTGNPYASLPAMRVVSPSGSYRLENLAPGTYALSFSAPGYGAAEKTGLAVMAGHNTAASVTLSSSGDVSGVVVSPRGVGIPGAAVRVDTGWLGEAAVTDSEGRFLLRDVAAGRRSLTATHPLFDTRIVSGLSIFPRDTAQVRVELQPKSGRQPQLRLSGIGVVISKKAGKLTVLKTLDGSPAAVAGIQPGDIIRTINGSALSFREAVEAIRGIIGTPVRLQLHRGGKTFDLDVIRDEVSVPGK